MGYGFPNLIENIVYGSKMTAFIDFCENDMIVFEYFETVCRI